MATANEVIVQVMSEVQALGKNDRNQAQGFNFRGIDAVMNVVGPALRKAGGFVTPNVITTDYAVIPARNGGNLNVCRLVIEFALYGTEGDPIRGQVAAEAFDSGDKATAKAMSVALRTFLLQTLALPTDEPDPDHYTYEIGKEAKIVDWTEAIDGLTSIEAARALYTSARQQQVSENVLAEIKKKADTLDGQTTQPTA